MNNVSTILNSSTLSRRGVLTGGAAIAALSITRSGWAQAGPTGAQPVVLITGTSSGFGRLMAETFARNSLHVVATMRETEGQNAPAAAELRQLAEREDLAIEVIDIDVTDQASVDSGVAEALQRAGQIDILVNNAGIVVPGPTELQPVASFDANLETNVNGSLRMFRAVAPHLRERGSGYLIQFSSALGRILDPMLGGYCASKLAAEAAADALAYEEAMFGIEVTIIQPAGAYPTRLQENAMRYFEEMVASLSDADQARLAAFEEHIAHMRESLVPDPELDPREVADAVYALIPMERGSRPRRLAVGPFKDTIDGLNRAHDEVQAPLIEQSGLTELTTLR
ncbi:MAG: SDR family NAD(P)-dependent oxidoreductase [Thermomicrobiales bacterium]